MILFVAAVEHGLGNPLKKHQQQKSVADSADVPTAAGFRRAECGVEKSHAIQAMPEQHEEKGRTDGEQHHRRGDTAVHLIHAANPVRHAARPKREGEKFRKHDPRARRQRPLAHGVRKDDVGQ